MDTDIVNHRDYTNVLLFGSLHGDNSYLVLKHFWYVGKSVYAFLPSLKGVAEISGTYRRIYPLTPRDHRVFFMRRHGFGIAITASPSFSLILPSCIASVLLII